MDKRAPVIRPKHTWSLWKGKCLDCHQYTREQVVHYFHIVRKNGSLKHLPTRNYEHYLCHSETCIDWRCIKLREDISRVAENIAKEKAEAKLEQFNQLTGP